jgi:hypothetical protein
MPSDLRHLALMDFLLEHFEEIPEECLNILFSHRAMAPPAAGIASPSPATLPNPVGVKSFSRRKRPKKRLRLSPS